jgi:hypothetical protein
MAINGQLITDDSKYKTHIMQIPTDLASLSFQNGNDRLASSAGQRHSGGNENGKHTVSYMSLTSNLNAEQMRHSFYDTLTNLTVDDVQMNMQGKVIECFAYSFLYAGGGGKNSANGHLNHNFYYLNKYNYAVNSNFNLNSFQNNVMNVKSIIQVDCEF